MTTAATIVRLVASFAVCAGAAGWLAWLVGDRVREARWLDDPVQAPPSHVRVTRGEDG